MGSSKKKKNTIRQPPTPYIGSNCRNLKKNQLGAVIYGCKNHTFTECLLKQLVGSETDLLQSLVVMNGKTVSLVQRPSRNFAEKWNALLYRHGLEGDPQVEAMLDKTICALSSVFIGSSGSTSLKIYCDCERDPCKIHFNMNSLIFHLSYVKLV